MAIEEPGKTMISFTSPRLGLMTALSLLHKPSYPLYPYPLLFLYPCTDNVICSFSFCSPSYAPLSLYLASFSSSDLTAEAKIEMPVRYVCCRAGHESTEMGYHIICSPDILLDVTESNEGNRRNIIPT